MVHQQPSKLCAGGSQLINNCMDYQKIYNSLIDRAKNRTLEEYGESHHIIPECMGGSNCQSNLVRLTPEEHHVAHQLLVKMYPKNVKLVYALNMMSMGRNSNKRYGWIKRKHQSLCKARIGKKNPSFGRSWYYCPNTYQSGKFKADDIPEGWIKGRIVKVGKIHEKERQVKEKERKLAEKKAKRQQLALSLFEQFKEGNYCSIQQFIDDGHYKYSNEALRMLWKENIPEYFENSSQGRPYKSKRP
jgi:hypothetical protein